jgi:hypothetical protein
MGRARALPAAAAAAAALAGCTPDPPAGGGVDAGAANSAAAAPSAPVPAPAPTASATQEPAAEHLELLRMTLTSGVKDKDPVDKLDAARAGERIYAHLAVRNRTGEPRKVEVAFDVNAKERSRIELEVRASWQWRTWGYNTLREADSGELTITVTEVDGPELTQVTVPIRRKGSAGR